MRELRMPKGWVLFGTNALEFGNTETKAEKVRRMRKFDNAIRNTKKAKALKKAKAEAAAKKKKQAEPEMVTA